MNLMSLLTLLKTSKIVHILIAVILAACVAAFTVSYVKNQYWSHIVASKTEQVQMLEKQVAEKDTKIAVLEARIDEAAKATAEATKIAKNAQAKTDELFKKWKELQAQLHPNTPPDALPSIPVEDNYKPIDTIKTLEDCTKTLEAERTQCTEEKTILAEEIVADRTLISTISNEKQLISEKADILTSEVTDLKTITNEQKVIIHTQDKQIDSERTKKKVYRGASGILLLIVTVLLL